MALRRGIALPSLLPFCSLIVECQEEEEELVRHISRAISSLGHPQLVKEFSSAVCQVEGTRNPDRLLNVPEIKPVVRLRVSKVLIVTLR